MGWGKVTLLWKHVLANLVASSVDSDFPVSNILSRREDTKYLAASTTTPIHIYPGSGPGGGDSLEADFFFLSGHNLHTIGAGIALEKSDTGNFTGEQVVIFPETESTPRPSARADHSAIVYNNKMYVFGGFDGSDQLNDLWEYDIGLDNWIQKTSGSTVRSAHTAIIDSGKMYIFGGWNGSGRLNDVWEYDIALDSWTQKTSGATTRQSHTAIVDSGKMYIFGGYTGTSNLDDVWEYDISGDSWVQKTSGATIRQGHTAIVDSGKMYIFGGDSNTIWEYDISGDSWLQKTSGATSRDRHSAVVANGKMYIFAGYSGTFLDDIWEYDISGDSWTQKTSGPDLRRSHSAVETNGKMYIFGGLGFGYLDESWVYNISGDSWSETKAFFPDNDFTLAKRFTSTTEDYWRLRITGALSAAPQIAICYWGERAEISRCTSSFDPNKRRTEGNINKSQGGIITGIHEKYRERGPITYTFGEIDADGQEYADLDEWDLNIGRELFGLMWEPDEHPTETYLMHNEKGDFDMPLTRGGSQRRAKITLTGRMEE